MIITISGKAGSGKSTIAKQLAKKLKLKHYSIGDLMRQIAKDKNISLMELSKLAEKDNSIDLELDKKNIELREENNFVIDGRLTAYFSPYAELKVFLDCDDEVRADRILKDERKDEKSKNIKESTKKIKQREQSERKRYKKLYNVDYCDKKLYNLIIDTTNLSIKEVVEKIIEAVK
ncbi:MAG: cytidylate kinase family protein [Flavobacteriales bacterium]|jgi:predicted cytidylate kinase|nr:cytidylate kinase family protein [Flavobacteriales bacterium]|tara:strand:- start:1200 stop:1727 length:528 start_codon:yes stop_codon:yes gene_type:complete